MPISTPILWLSLPHLSIVCLVCVYWKQCWYGYVAESSPCRLGAIRQDSPVWYLCGLIEWCHIGSLWRIRAALLGRHRRPTLGSSRHLHFEISSLTLLFWKKRYLGLIHAAYVDMKFCSPFSAEIIIQTKVRSCSLFISFQLEWILKHWL